MEHSPTMSQREAIVLLAGERIPASVEGPGGHSSALPRPVGLRRRRALVWGVASSALSAAGLIAFALFEQYNGILAELRGDLKRFHETSAEYIKKDQLQRMREQMRDFYKEAMAGNAARALLEQELKSSERAREELGREMQRVRERLAYVEGMRAARGGAETIPTHPDHY